ncbi:ROK family protein [Flavihumibacter petaseus]|uniref:ROK family protein n=1 Tax=Flavihumibacter petaseus NBRC 106054 TaxID=1220578 RepID=A0A0E9N155_9BACT|nr:ROK family protein [Flavihumibacter petaseus]GAO43366.1 ROK family protein [Flavihumibacter petaseus NBRC 106054]
MYHIGIDLGGTIIKIGVVQAGSVMALQTLDASSGKGLQNSLSRIDAAITGLLQSQQLDPSDLGGIGLAFPGIVDPRRKKVLSTNKKYDDAIQLDLVEWAQQQWKVPLYLDNDARLSLIGEWQYGAGKGYNDMVMVTIGTGIGTGVVMDGKVLYGAHFQGGSLGGHFTIDYKGRTCNCGNRGCVEAMASSAFLSAVIRDHAAVTPAFKERAFGLDFREIFLLAGGGDSDALLVRNECLDVWAAALTTFIHAYDPSVIVLAGGIMNSSEVILPYLKQKVASLAWTPTHTVDIVLAQKGDHAALLGASFKIQETITAV